MTRRIWFALLALASVLAPAAAHAQDFPSRRITLVVPAPPGGPTDAYGRLIAEALGDVFNQRILIENVVGAGGVVGARRVSQAAPDGYTVLIFNTALTSIPAFSKSADMDPLRDLAPVGLVNESPFVLIARPNYPPNDAASLLAHMRAEGDRTRIGHGGFGGGAHICGLLIARALGVTPDFVAYRGAAPVMTDILGGHVDLFCAQTADAIRTVSTRAVKGYLVTGPSQLPQLPQLPTVSALQLRNSEMTVWHAMFLPPGTPPAIRRAMETALGRALDDPRVRERFAALGVEPTPPARRGAEALGVLLDEEVKRWRSLVADMRITPE